MRVITIGRSLECNIVVNDIKVSRVHLQLVQDESGVCFVVDFNSANGTFVNGQKIAGKVRLQPYDEIRIGSTKLPWQEYIKASSSVGLESMDVVHHTKKTNKRWWLVAACVVAVLFVSGIVLYFYYDGREQERIKAAKQNHENIQKELLRKEAEQKEEEARRLEDEVDEIFRQALISQNDKNKALAEAKQKEANAAKKQAKAATTAKLKAEKDRIAAEQAKKEAQQAKAIAEQNSKEAIRIAEEKTNLLISKANTERDYATKKAELIEIFYEEYAVMKSGFAKQVYEQLQYELPKDKKGVKIALKELFNQSGNKDKQAIVDAIQVVKQQNSKTKTSDSEEKSDSLKSSQKGKDLTNNKMLVKNDE
ncbi:MAG: FHA domain-containing protein [Bacteroidaceae bacterium]|nr:FHA domain-containing protein [Bacteroidaceae bacterium]